jgi:hypothetical protein
MRVQVSGFTLIREGYAVGSIASATLRPLRDIADSGKGHTCACTKGSALQIILLP